MRTGSAHGQRLWPMLLLLVAVIVPTVSMLWFMLAAIDNERVAVRQRLVSAYRAQLIGVKTQLAARLQQSAAELDRRFVGESCASVFASLVRAGEADSVICADDDAPYPARPEASSVPTTVHVEGWDAAARLERRTEYDEAARAFARIADDSADGNVAARALQARARCLSKTARRDDAIGVLVGELAQPRYRSAADSRGRLIAPSARLLALQLIDDPEQAQFQTAATALRERLSDYDDPVIPAAQRRFLMSELRTIAPDTPSFDTRAAEDLAAAFLQSGTQPGAASELTRSGPGGVWQLVSASARIVVLHTDASLRERLLETIAETDLSAEATVDLLVPGVEPDPATIRVSFAADE